MTENNAQPGLKEIDAELAAKLDMLRQRIPATDNTARYFFDAVQQHLLSKLRAPVADERAALVWYAEQVAGCRKFGPDGEGARNALDKDGGERARAALASARVVDRQRLRELVDVVWNEATESTAVPDTPWADRLIDKVFPSLASAPATDETHTDEKGTVWTRPTAGAYAQVCKARDKWQAAASLSKPAPVWNNDYKHDVSMFQPKAQASAPVAGEAQAVALVEVSVPHLRSISVKIIPDAPMPNVGDLLYAAPQASNIDDANKPKEQS